LVRDAWGRVKAMSDVLKSAEVRKRLKLSTCDLAHLREAGSIGFVKKGNAFLYSKKDCDKIAKGAPLTPPQSRALVKGV
jgi:hypothetical protein